MTYRIDRTAVVDVDTVCMVETDNGKALAPVTRCIDWAALVLGYNRITADNAADIVTRFRLYRALVGDPFAYDRNGEPVWPTTDDVAAHIGWQSNATPMTFRQFMAHVDRIAIRCTRDEAQRHLDRLAGSDCICADAGEAVHGCLPLAGRRVIASRKRKG